jgi:hypothetical protein
MFPALFPLLLGGGLGALTTKKDPLKGALLGAGLGALGGGTGLFGGFGGTPFNPAAAASDAVPAVFNAAKDSQAANVALGMGPSGGLLGTLKEFGPAAGQLANSGLLDSQDPQVQPPAPMTQNSGGAQTLAMLAQQGEQGMQAQLAQDAKIRRKRRMGLFSENA